MDVKTQPGNVPEAVCAFREHAAFKAIWQDVGNAQTSPVGQICMVQTMTSGSEPLYRLFEMKVPSALLIAC